jgi:DNA-binding response OmpR family regulator
MHWLLLTDDLMLQSQVTQAARQLGVTCTTFSSIETAAESDVSNTHAVLVDLDLPRLDLNHLADHLQRMIGHSVTIWAVGPHVHKDRLNAARAAGLCVLTRGQLHASVQQLLSGELKWA